MKKRTKTNWLVLHCSATRAIQDIGASDIRKWHRAKGWEDIGYHYVIRRSGKIETGRSRDVIGSHVQGRNADSIGICLVGGLNDDTYKPEDNFTPQQWEALEKLIRGLLKAYPSAKILGHRDFPGVKKACPCFDARKWAKSKAIPT